MALVIGTEGIDLSVGSVMALARRAASPLYLGYGALAGDPRRAGRRRRSSALVNGALVAFVGVQPIVATLALLVAGRGLALVIADGAAASRSATRPARARLRDSCSACP